MPPIYQPELAARGILYAADHPRRREYWIGGSTMATLAANAIVPCILDRYQAKTGFPSQQGNRPVPAGQPATNLWQPADGPGGHDYTARGSFDARSKDRSLQWWASQHHGLLAAAAAGLSAAAALAARHARR